MNEIGFRAETRRLYWRGRLLWRLLRLLLGLLRCLGSGRRLEQRRRAKHGDEDGTRGLKHGHLANRALAGGVYYMPTVLASFTTRWDTTQTKTRTKAGLARWRLFCKSGGMQKADDWTIERWKTEPRLVGLEYSDPIVDKAPPLWKDLTVASALALLLWGAAAIVFS